MFRSSLDMSTLSMYLIIVLLSNTDMALVTRTPIKQQERNRDLAAGGTLLTSGKIGDTGPFLFYFTGDSYIDLVYTLAQIPHQHLTAINI
jgi:hypothetical protein